MPLAPRWKLYGPLMQHIGKKRRRKKQRKAKCYRHLYDPDSVCPGGGTWIWCTPGSYNHTCNRPTGFAMEAVRGGAGKRRAGYLAAIFTFSRPGSGVATLLQDGPYWHGYLAILPTAIVKRTSFFKQGPWYQWPQKFQCKTASRRRALARCYNACALGLGASCFLSLSIEPWNASLTNQEEFIGLYFTCLMSSSGVVESSVSTVSIRMPGNLALSAICVVAFKS